VFALRADGAGKHTFLLFNNGEKDTRSAGTRLALHSIRVQPARRLSSLPAVLGLILALEALFLGLAFLLGRRWFSVLAERLSTRLSLLLTLAGFAALAGYGLLADSVLDYAVLAWLGASGLGGSRALSRSLAASLLPAARSGEFFGLFGTVQNLALLLSPPLFTGAFALLGSFRAALLLPALLLAGGALLLLRLNEEEGRRVARAEEERLRGDT
jgi:UMF1 family MFS transporter